MIIKKAYKASKFAISVFDENNDVLRYNVSHAELVIRHSIDRKLQLYDRKGKVKGNV